jgi:hypothetical protein
MSKGVFRSVENIKPLEVCKKIYDFGNKDQRVENDSG